MIEHASDPRHFTTEASVAAEWNIGDILLDLYEVKGVLGQGGMGKVYKVHHRAWGLDLAVKSPRPEFMSTENGRLSFVREAETWVNLGLHPQTVSCYYVRTLGGIPRVFAEYVEGGSLEDWIKKGRLYEGTPEQILERILDISIQMAWGLHYAHEAELIHQDVKPANVMMTPDGTAKVTDFGLAKAKMSGGDFVLPQPAVAGQSIQIPGAGVCTPEYASPEQIGREPLSRRTDIWSWGVSVLEMFVGDRPIVGPVAMDFLEEYVEGESLRSDIPHMPSAAITLLRSCFQLDPDDRPHTLNYCAGMLENIYAEATGRRYPRPRAGQARVQVDGMNNRAVSLLDLGYAEEAEKLLEEALKVDANHMHATHNLGILLWRSGRLSETAMLLQMRKVRATHPPSWEDTYLMGCVHLERGDAGPAEAALLQAAEEAGQDASAHQAIAEVQGMLKESSRCLGVLTGHEGEVYSVAVAPDGTLAVSGGADHTVRVWDLTTGLCRHVLRGHNSPAAGVCISSDGRIAVSASADTTLRVWDTETGDCMGVIQHTWSVRHVAITGDGRHAVAGSMDKSVTLWDVATGQCLGHMLGHTEGVLGVAITLDGMLAISGSEDGTARVWNVQTGLCCTVLSGHTGPVNSVSITPDGRMAVSGSADHTLRVWDTVTGRCLRILEGHVGNVKGVAITHDGYGVVSASATEAARELDDTVRAWDLTSGRCVAILSDHRLAVNSVSITWDGRMVLSAGSDTTVGVWHVAPTLGPPALVRPRRSEEVLMLQERYADLMTQANEAVKAQRWTIAVETLNEARSLPGYERSPDCIALLETLYPKTMRGELRGIRSEATLQGHKGAIRAVACSRNGRRILSAGSDGAARLWDVTTGKAILEAGIPPQQKMVGVALSADGRLGLVPTREYGVAVWEVASGKVVRTLAGHSHAINGMKLTSDGRLACTASADGNVRVWSIASGKCLQVLTGGGGWMYGAALSADGRIVLSAGADGPVRMWDTSSARLLRTLEGHRQVVTSVQMTPDGRLAVSAGMDKTVRVWDLESGACLWVMEGHKGPILALALTPDGRIAVSASEDRTLIMWDVVNGRNLRTLEGHTGPANCVAITPNARLIVSGSDDQTVRVWYLDWALIGRDAADWDEGARPCLQAFVASRPRSTAGILKTSRITFTEADLKDLLEDLSDRGYGWLRPEGVLTVLKIIVSGWTAPPPLG